MRSYSCFHRLHDAPIYTPRSRCWQPIRTRTWYNKKQKPQRKGAFWVRRFKNTILLDGKSVLNGLLYVENNAVRAGAASRVDEYVRKPAVKCSASRSRKIVVIYC